MIAAGTDRGIQDDSGPHNKSAGDKIASGTSPEYLQFIPGRSF